MKAELVDVNDTRKSLSVEIPSDVVDAEIDRVARDYSRKARYTARVRHWTVADREAHEKMGFHGGWGLCTDQLAALVARL